MDRVTGASKFRCPGCRQSVMEQVLEEVFAEDFWGVLEANPVLNAAIDERPEVREAAVSLATTNRKLAEVERERTSADEALYIRLPKPGERCPITGLGRAKLNELILPNPRNKHRPPVESISLKQPGQTKGVRLIVRKSLLEFCRKSGLKTSGNSEKRMLMVNEP
jgi:hypothetical protein